MDSDLWCAVAQSERDADGLNLLSNSHAKSAVKHCQTALQVSGMCAIRRPFHSVRDECSSRQVPLHYLLHHLSHQDVVLHDL